MTNPHSTCPTPDSAAASDKEGSAMRLADADARHTITHDTNTNYFVEAGAGSGKTFLMVQRILTLLIEDGVPVTQIAAITFTEKAAGELADRLRGALLQIAETGQFTTSVSTRSFDNEAQAKQRAAEALTQLPSAAVSTLHSFCNRIINDFPLQAGVPPTITVADDIAGSMLAADRTSRITHLVGQACLDEEELAATLTELGNPLPVATVRHAINLLVDAGLNTRLVDQLASWLDEHWGEITDEHLRYVPLPEPTAGALAHIADQARALAAKSSTPDDKLAQKISGFAAEVQELSDALAAGGSIHGQELPKINKQGGRVPAWQAAFGKEDTVKLVRAEAAAIEEELAEIFGNVMFNASRVLVILVATIVLAHARTRIREGSLDHHDLIYLADRLIATNESVRASLHETYTRILVDEFQDTDPAQLRIVTAIAGNGGTPLPGRLTTVGDPKQSIYRFRRADIDTYLSAKQEEHFTPIELTCNFRSTPVVLDWINDVFAQWFVEAAADAENTALDKCSTAPRAIDYVGLTPDPAKVGREDNTAAFTLEPQLSTTDAGSDSDAGSDADTDASDTDDAEAFPLNRADDYKALERREILAILDSALTGNWDINPDYRHLGAIPAGDITILVTSHKNARNIMNDLDRAGIAYQSEGSTLAYQGLESETLHVVLRAVANPFDAYAVAAALRSPALGVTDPELVDWANTHPDYPWQLRAFGPEDTHPVACGLNLLNELREYATSHSVADTVDHTIDTLGLVSSIMAAYTFPDDALRRLQFISHNARSFTDNAPGGLSSYVAWADNQALESNRVSDNVTESNHNDRVRIMTIHAAKGREFPMVIMSSLSDSTAMQHVSVGMDHSTGQVEFGTSDIGTSGLAAMRAFERAASQAERARLFYVAATRAEKILAVPLVVAPTSKDSPKKDLWGRYCRNALDDRATTRLTYEPTKAHEEQVRPLLWHTTPAGTDTGTGTGTGTDPAPGEGQDPIAAEIDALWARLDEAQTPIEEATRTKTRVSATGIAHDETFKLIDIADFGDMTHVTGQAKKAHGKEYGTAVHAALEKFDITHPDQQAAAHAAVAATGIALSAQQRHAVLSDVLVCARDERIARALRGTHRREVNVLGRVDGITVDGVIDVLYQDADTGEWVIADYKTDAGVSDQVQREYFTQLELYAQLIGSQLGGPVARLELWFIRNDRVECRTHQRTP